MKFNLYIVAYTISKYKEELKKYIEIINKYNFNESEDHDIYIGANRWVWQNYDSAVKYAGTIKIDNLNDMVSLRNDLQIDFIVSEENSIILCNDRME